MVAGDAPVGWEQAVVYLDGETSFFVAVEIRAVGFAALRPLRNPTFLLAEVLGVVLLLLPSVASGAAVLEFAAVFVGLGVLLGLPSLALVLAVLKEMRLAAEVLPIVGVDTNVALVVFVGKGTPNGLKMEHVKVGVTLHALENVDTELALLVRKGTHVSVVAAVDLVRVALAELALVFFGVVKFFDSILRMYAYVTIGALLVGVETQLAGVKGGRPSAVLLVGLVEEKALLRVVS